MRVGFGYDSHKFVEGRSLILGGTEIPHEKGLLGHSDADVLLHAICDAILGSIAEGDIGRHFPDKDPAYKGVSSLKLLKEVQNIADKKGFYVNNIDSAVVLEKPKLGGYIDEMTKNIATVLNMPKNMINIKATTNEGMGFIGRGEGVAAYAVVTVREKKK